jgi:glycosyltransferase involved in cell wall biosynthesis
MMAVTNRMVSIVMPVFNAIAYLSEAIQSVLAQTYAGWELLLVDDASTDGSLALATSYSARFPDHIRVIRHDAAVPRGASAARNLALAHASGEFVAFLDADDVWLPENLASQVSALEAAPEVGLLYSRTLYWYSWAGTGRARDDYVSRLRVPSGRPIEGARLLALCVAGKAAVPCTCSLLVRRSLIEGVGGFEDQFLRLYTDQAFYSKLFLATAALPVDGCWAKYRQHAASSTGTAQREHRAREARQAFLRWLEVYVRGASPDTRALDRAIRRELWRCHHPLGDYLLDQLSYLRRGFHPFGGR